MIETSLAPNRAPAMSRRPSRLKSPKPSWKTGTSEDSWNGVAAGVGPCVTRIPSELATTRSVIPSPVTSPTAEPKPNGPTGMNEATKVPSPLPNRREALRDSKFMTIRSVLVSALTSPAVIEAAPAPTVTVLVDVMPPSPSPSRTVTFPNLLLAVAMSNFVSPLKSPVATPKGADPTGTAVPPEKFPPPSPRKVTIVSSAVETIKSIKPSAFKSPEVIQ